MDNFCDLVLNVVAWHGYLLHIGRLLAYSAGPGNRSGADPGNPGPKSCVIDSAPLVTKLGASEKGNQDESNADRGNPADGVGSNFFSV